LRAKHGREHLLPGEGAVLVAVVVLDLAGAPTPSRRITAGRVSPCTTSVNRITMNAMKMMRLRPGNGWPASVVVGRASATASEIAPRVPH
jgi:hypothetical protein